jgi:hypothetical protein
VFPQRSASVYLVDDTLLAYRSASSFNSDSTDFHLSLAAKIKNGNTTEQQIYAAPGPPSGRATYPLAASPGGHSIFYEVTLWNDPLRGVTKKRLSIYLTQDGVIEDFFTDSRIEPTFSTAPPRRFGGRPPRIPAMR